MKAAFPDILENQTLRGRLKEEICSGKLSHAYILSGQDGSGRHTLAVQIAAALSCENRERSDAPLPCGGCLSCRKILGGSSPDVIFIRRKPDRATLGVESIRFLKEDLLIAPNDTDSKVYIIEDADTMTVQAQNALLLSLEEPPAYARFLLICTDPKNLLETIRSRAPIFRLEMIPPEVIRAYLEKTGKTSGLSPEELAGIVTGAGGSIGRALELLHPDERKPLLRRRDQVRRFLSVKNAEDYLAAATELGTKREELAAFFSVLTAAIRDLLAVRKCEESPPLSFWYSADEAEQAARLRSSSEWFGWYQAVTDAADLISRNANVRLTFTRLGMRLGVL